MATTLEQILHISQQIVTNKDFETTVENAVKLLAATFDGCGFAVWLNHTQSLELVASAGSPNPYSPGPTDFPDAGVAGWVAAHGQTAIASDIDLPSQADYELGLPLRIEEEAIGVLGVYCLQDDKLDDADIKNLEIVASFLAVAMVNAHENDKREHELAEQKYAVEVLRAGEEMFRQVVASVSAHIYVTEVTEDNKLLNHYIAPNVEGLTGYPHEKFIKDWGFWPNTVIYPSDRRRAAAQARRLQEGATSTAEYRLQRADGHVIWVRDSGRVERRGDSWVIYGVVSDITDRKEAELALQNERSLLAQRVSERTSELSAANAKLARAARLKDEFLANMSHELRTPLNAILGMAEVLQSGVYGELNDEQHNAARHIQESGSHLLSLITDILDLSKIEADKLTLEIGQVYVDYVCEASLRMINQAARKKRIKVSSQFDERVTSIQADQRRLKQILVNLLINAVKFTPEGGQIGLYVQGDQQKEVVRFIVWDTGIGIDAQDMGELFKPFVQLDSKLSRQHEGSGLGLSLVARLAELHNGGVSVESELGKGSRFVVSLPWQEAEPVPLLPDETAQSESPESANPASDGASKQQVLILLAEDNEANVITLTEFLTSMDYQVIVARNGKEAIDRAIEERPDIVLMDIQMPEVDGLEATRTIRANDKLADLPIIALTALAMPGDRERCLEAGANDYLSKPVSLRRLIEKISVHLQGTVEDD
jgi:PAS domain S-box-containing protein